MYGYVLQEVWDTYLCATSVVFFEKQLSVLLGQLCVDPKHDREHAAESHTEPLFRVCQNAFDFQLIQSDENEEETACMKEVIPMLQESDLQGHTKVGRLRRGDEIKQRARQTKVSRGSWSGRRPWRG